MTSGRRFFFLLLTNENCTSSWKKKWPLLVVLIHSVYGRVSERKGRKKIEKINVTFSLSGWAMPFQHRGPRLWEVLTLSPQPRSHRQRFPGAPRKNIPWIPPIFASDPCAAGSCRYRQITRDAANLNQRRPIVRLSSKEKHWQICCFKSLRLFPVCVGCCVFGDFFFFTKAINTQHQLQRVAEMRFTDAAVFCHNTFYWRGVKIWYWKLNVRIFLSLVGTMAAGYNEYCAASAKTL